MGLLSVLSASAQYAYEPSPEHPFGLPNPDAPQELLDWAPLIGECACTSVSRKADNSWGEPVAMTWRFKYIMNGTAIQDETLKADGAHSGSIRQFIPDSTSWYVHYYSNRSPSPRLPAWEGGKTETGEIVLKRDQKAPNGMDGYYRITFSGLDGSGYDWAGEWVSRDGSFVFPTWKIQCKRPEAEGDANNQTAIREAAARFSQGYMDGDYPAMMQVYHPQARILPPGADIISGADAIQKRWVLPEGLRILEHRSTPESIVVLGDTAYDFGYYQGRTRLRDGSESAWRGKYVIVWKQHQGQWKMLLDIWNRVDG